MNRTALLTVVVLWFLSMARGVAQDAEEVDVLLRGGTVIDGSGSPGRTADVAIRDDRIVAIGELKDLKADWTIDCAGLVVCPGFIDLHNHSDRQIVKAATRANMNYVLQGCTTIVTGNCGSGPVDAGNFYQQIDDHGAGTNVAHLLPQGSLRQSVMGSDLRAPTDDEHKRMLELAAKAMDDGVWGMSSGLIYVPSSYAKTEELIAIAKVVAEGGGIYASHIRNEGARVLIAVDEALTIGREAGLPVHISHFKSSGQENWGLVREAARRIAKARAEGQTATADQYPYIASSTSLGATLMPSWARAGGRAKVVKRLDSRETGPKIRDLVLDAIRRRNDGDAVRIARYSKRGDWVGKSLLEIARAEERPAIDIAYEIFRGGDAQIVNFSMSEEDVRHIMAIDWVATASDGRAYQPGADRPHPRNYGTFPRKIGYYALQEEVLSAARAIRSCSALPATILGLVDRGLLREKHFADVVVFDPEKLRDMATFDDPHQYAVGIRYVFVNGRPAVVRGAATGGLHGRALRHQSVAADSANPQSESQGEK